MLLRSVGAGSWRLHQARNAKTVSERFEVFEAHGYGTVELEPEATDAKSVIDCGDTRVPRGAGVAGFCRYALLSEMHATRWVSVLERPFRWSAARMDSRVPYVAAADLGETRFVHFGGSSGVTRNPAKDDVNSLPGWFGALLFVHPRRWSVAFGQRLFPQSAQTMSVR